MNADLVVAGQPLRISSGDWNALMRLLRASKAAAPKRNGETLPDGSIPSCIILAHNDSESITYPAQGVVGLPNHAIDPADAPVDNARRPVALAGLPDGIIPYGVALLPIPPGNTGYVVVAGVTSANIEVTDITHEYAVAVSGDNTKLTTAASGPIRLLTRFGSTASNVTGLVFVGVVDPGDSSLLVSETDTEAATEMAVDTDELAAIMRALRRDFYLKKGATTADPKTLAIRYSKSITYLSKLCPVYKWLSVVDGVLLGSDTDNGGIRVLADLTLERISTTLPGGVTISDPTCSTVDTDCCPDPCPACTCEGLEKLEVGTNTFTAVPVTSHDGIAEGEFYMQWALDWLFCPPRGECSYTVTVTAVNATYSGTCINPSFFGAPFVYLEAKSLDAACLEVSTLDTDSQDGTCPSTFPTATITIPAAETDCVRRNIRFTINVYSDTDSPAATADFVITIAEAVCA